MTFIAEWGSNPKAHPGYNSWRGIKQMCYNSNCSQYSNVGARGIEMYEPWKNHVWTFLDWLDAHLGPKPQGHNLDRIDKHGHYEPGNLRWATPRLQHNTRTNNTYLTFNGRTETLANWCREYGTDGVLAWKRIHEHKWTPWDAITTPPGKIGHKCNPQNRK
jgi:hypothetical protein